jgi:hypothetical protein
VKSNLKGFILGPKDESFFSYLHQVKIASLFQINRDVYGYEKFRNVYERVATLERVGLLTQACHVALPKQKLVTLSRKGFDEFVSTGDERVVELRSDSIAHDVKLVDIRQRLLNSEKVIEYFTENTLQTWPERLHSEELRPFVEDRCDAAIKARFPTGEVFLAVEYEASRKFATRIRETIGKYYNTEEIPAVLYVCADENILQAHMQEEKRNFSKYDPRIYYKTIENFFHDQTLAFRNREGETLRLGRKIGE